MVELLFPLESQGARRRAQLTLAAAHIIAAEGLSACDHARVAEVSGATRPLVYKYFPKREDLLFAVLLAADEAQDRKASPDIVARGIEGLARGSGEVPSDDTAALLDHYVGPPGAGTTDRDLSVAGITITRAMMVENLLGAHAAAFAERLQRRWIAPLRRIGLGEAESRVALVCLIALINDGELQVIAGEIDPAEAQRLFLRTANAIVQGLL